MFLRFTEIAVGALIFVACSPSAEPVIPTLPTSPTAAPAARSTDQNVNSTPTLQAVPTTNAPSGILAGHVTIGPLQPVQRVGPPPTTPPQVYAARSIDVFLADGKTRVANVRIDSDGTFRIALPPGTYVIALARSGIDRARELPKMITVESGKTIQLDVDIDTGIR